MGLTVIVLVTNASKTSYRKRDDLYSASCLFSGASQHSNGGDISSALKRLLEIKRTSPQGGVKYNITSSAELHNIVNTRFRTEMAVLFSRLPKSDQCNILVAVSETTQCTVPDIIELLFSLTEMKQNVNVSCPVSDRNKLKLCSQANRTFIGETFCNELLNVFKSLPSPFKCHIINAIALAYSLKGRRNLALSVSQTQNAVAEIFPSVSLPNTCADLEMDRIIPSIPPVNITVVLSNADKQTWLQTLKKKGPKIFKTVLKHEYDMSHPGKLWNPTSLAQHLKEHEVNSTQLVTVGVEGGSRIFSVLFRLKVKRKRLREIRSTYRIVEALAAKKQLELREIFNATIIAISLGGERSNVKTPPKTDTWTLDLMDMAKTLFPAYLSEYYKQLGKPARCFVVFYISLKMDKSPKAVEMFYSSFKRLSRKHTCYYTGRTGPTGTPILSVFTPERFNKNNKSQSTQAFSIERTEKPSTASDGAIDHVSDKVDTEDLSSLEIALFALLGVLCACVLAFTINCVMLALKVKPTDRSNGRANPMLHTAVFHKGTSVAGCKETECVHFTDTNDSNCQPSNTEHPSKVETVVYSDKSCNCLCLISGSTPHNIRRCDLNKTCLKSSQPVLHDKIGAKRTNSKTQLENDCLSPVARTFDSSQLCVDDTAENCPSNMEKTSKSKCQCPRRTLDSQQGNDRVLESQGKAISYCSISDTSYKEHLCPKMKHNGCLPTEESHATVIVMLDCKGFKEAQV